MCHLSSTTLRSSTRIYGARERARIETSPSSHCHGEKEKLREEKRRSFFREEEGSIPFSHVLALFLSYQRPTDGPEKGGPQKSDLASFSPRYKDGPLSSTSQIAFDIKRGGGGHTWDALTENAKDVRGKREDSSFPFWCHIDEVSGFRLGEIIFCAANAEKIWMNEVFAIFSRKYATRKKFEVHAWDKYSRLSVTVSEPIYSGLAALILFPPLSFRHFILFVAFFFSSSRQISSLAVDIQYSCLCCCVATAAVSAKFNYFLFFVACNQSREEVCSQSASLLLSSSWKASEISLRRNKNCEGGTEIHDWQWKNWETNITN